MTFLIPHGEIRSYSTSIDVLVGRKAVLVENRNRDELVFHLSDGTAYVFYHNQDCCENVYIEDVSGDLNDLVGYTILLAESIDSEGHPPPDGGESFTWTFYKFATVKGYVTVRWLGESNGYYSEGVDFCRIENWTDSVPLSELDAMDVAADLAEANGEHGVAAQWRAVRAQFH